MPFVSLNVFAEEEFALPKRLLLFDKGTNVTNLFVKGDLDEFLSEIADAGGKVIACHRLDDLTPVAPATLEYLPPGGGD